jgi:uncharacterized protein
MLLPLHVFEERYRMLMTDIMSGDGEFGLSLYETYNPQTLRGTPHSIGTVAQVLEIEELPDGRFYIVVLGCERYRIRELDMTSRPYMLASIQPYLDIEEEKIGRAHLQEIQTFFLEAVRLSHKVAKNGSPPTLQLPPDPSDLSFLIADAIKAEHEILQELLELQSSAVRLEYEYEILQALVSHLAAFSQIEQAFQ